MKVLLAVDGSDFSAVAAREVARRPWPTGSEVKVISVVEPPTPPPPEMWGAAAQDYFTEFTELHEKEARQALELAVQTLATNEDKTLKVSTQMFNGMAKQVILDKAEAWDADLIVVGSHGRGFWGRLLLGSVSQAVAAHAKCSVEIVRPH